MSPVLMDPTWALLTLVITALVGMTLWLAMMVVVESRKVSKNAKRVTCAVAFIVYMAWLFTVGNPRSSVNLETLYYQSINYLPDIRITKGLKRGSKTNTVAISTNAPVTLQTNK